MRVGKTKKCASTFFVLRSTFTIFAVHVVQKPEVGKWAGADIMESVYMTLDS